MMFGLPDNSVAQLQRLFASHPDVRKVILYGSRAKGNYRDGSDIDLTLEGEGLTLKELNRIEQQIDDLLLPWSVDLSLLEHIDNPDLIAHIRRVGQVFYLR